VSLISERFSGLYTFIQKVFLFRYKFKFRFIWERSPPGLKNMKIDFEEISELLEGFLCFSEGIQSKGLGFGHFNLILRQEGKFVVTSKLIYKIKNYADGNIEMYKSCFMA
jgi:hypothetical protein